MYPELTEAQQDYVPRRSVTSMPSDGEQAPEKGLLQELLGRIESLIARVGVIGMGYVGLPLAMEFASKGYRVTGFNIDATKVGALNAGRGYIRHIPSEQIVLSSCARFQGHRGLRATRRDGRHHRVRPHPTWPAPRAGPLLHRQYRPLHRRIPAPGQLVVLESTTYPGTTSREVKPILETTGLQCGVDFFLAFSPEREDPNNPAYRLATIPSSLEASLGTARKPPRPLPARSSRARCEYPRRRWPKRQSLSRTSIAELTSLW